MKKIIFGCILYLLGYLNVNAQQTTKPIRLGMKIAPNISWMNPSTKQYHYDGITGGLTVGLMSDFYFAEYYAFSTGVDFAFLNGKLSYTDSLVIDGTGQVGEMNRKYKFIYLDVPLMIKMQTREFGRFSFFGQLGFGIGFRLQAKTRDTFHPKVTDEYEETSEITAETSLIKGDVRIGGGASFHLDDRSAIQVGVNYSNSLNNILNGTNNYTKVNEKALLNYVELMVAVIF